MPKLSRIKNLLNIWSSRDLTPIVKIVIIKTFALSQLVYVFTVLPLPPSNFFRDLETMFYSFIWSKKPDKIQRSVLINKKCYGGLNMIDIESIAKSLQCKLVKLYFDENRSPWKLLFDFNLKNYGGKLLFQSNFHKKWYYDLQQFHSRSL